MDPIFAQYTSTEVMCQLYAILGYNSSMHLDDKIYTYYYQNRNLLDDSRLFHFANRTAAWLGKPEAYEILRYCQDFIAPRDKSLDELIADIYNSQREERSGITHQLRKPFFEKYPDLHGAQLALFRVRHLKEVYGIDARQALFASISEKRLIQLRDSLLADSEAMRTLSTAAINYCYLLERVVLEDDDSLPIKFFLDLGKAYDTSDRQQVKLLIYLYTHCIIGESKFYARTIPAKNLGIYKEMLSVIEALIADNFADVSLDNKLEYLVCARICGYDTHLANKIYDECQQSISPDGTYLVDTINNYHQETGRDIIRSEHRNILYVMSCSEYKPHSIAIS